MEFGAETRQKSNKLLFKGDFLIACVSALNTNRGLP